MVNSPITVLTSSITSEDTTIPVGQLSVFPAAPNQATIRSATDPSIDPETILYTGKSAASGVGNLTGVTRQFDNNGTYGLTKAWESGDYISRNFTYYDFTSILSEIDNIKSGSSLATDHTYNGIYAEQTVGSTLAFGTCVILKSDGKWYEAVNSSEESCVGDVGIVVEYPSIAEDATGSILKIGYVRDDDYNWTIGSPLYISNVSGTLTHTIPTGAGTFVRKVGIAVTADILWFFPDTTVVEISENGVDYSSYSNMDGGTSTSIYGGTTGINSGGAS